MKTFEKIMKCAAVGILLAAMALASILGYVIFTTDTRPPATTGLVVGSADCSKLKECV